MPFGTVLSPEGIVLSVGVVSTPERVATLWDQARYSEHRHQPAPQAAA